MDRRDFLKTGSVALLGSLAGGSALAVSSFTVNSPSILVLQPGGQSLNGMIADVGSGILVTGFNGGNCNSSTGDFSYGIEGFLVENGRLTQPV